MTPHQLDIMANGAFIYERPDGSRYASIDYKQREYGIPCVGRMGPLLVHDLDYGVAAYLDRCNAALAAGARSDETNEDLAQSVGRQSGPKGNAQ